MAFRTLNDALRDAASRLGNEPALYAVSGDSSLPRPLRWLDYERRSRELASGLLGLGLRTGDRVALLSAPSPEWLITALGAMGAGLVPAALHLEWPLAVLVTALLRARARAVLVDRTRLEPVLELKARLPELEHVLCVDAEAPGARSWQSVLGASGVGSQPLAPEQPAFLLFTSGLSGEPKEVLVSHENLLWTGAKLVRALGAGEGEVVLASLSLAGASSLALALPFALLCAAQVHLDASQRPLAALRRVRPTRCLGLPEHWERLGRTLNERWAAETPSRQRVLRWGRDATLERSRLEAERQAVSALLTARQRTAGMLVLDPLKKELGLDRARFLGSVGPLSSRSLELLASFDLPVHEVYGQAETLGFTALNLPFTQRWGTQGRPLPGTALRVAANGALWVRSGSVPDALRQELGGEPGWLATGDRAELDLDGFLKVAGRMTDGFELGPGRRVMPLAIETELNAIPLVERSVVFRGEGGVEALLVLDLPEVRKRASTMGLPEDESSWAEHLGLRAELQRAVAAVSESLAPHEQITACGIVPALEPKALGPLGKIRREELAPAL